MKNGGHEPRRPTETSGEATARHENDALDDDDDDDDDDNGGYSTYLLSSCSIIVIIRVK